MFQTICKLGPLKIADYGFIVAIIAALSIVCMIGVAMLSQNKQKGISIVLFWTLVLAVLAMVPVMLPVTVYSYGLMLAIAVIAATLTLAADARKNNVKPELIFDLVFWVVIGGILGARTFYVLMNFPAFLEDPREIIMIQNGGLAWQGGLIAGFFSAVLFVKSRRQSLLKVLDLAAPYVALGQSIGRIGCFLNGCCYGRELFFGVYFPIHDAILHPTQLYLSTGYLFIFVILKRYQRSSENTGLIFTLYLILAASLRFVVEFFRADHDNLLFGLSIYQFVCIGILFFAIGFAYAVLIKNSQDEL